MSRSIDRYKARVAESRNEPVPDEADEMISGDDDDVTIGRTADASNPDFQQGYADGGFGVFRVDDPKFCPNNDTSKDNYRAGYDYYFQKNPKQPSSYSSPSPSSKTSALNPFASMYPTYNPTAGKFAAGGAAASQCHAVSHSWQSTLLMILSLVLLFVFVDVVVRVWSFVRAKRITNRASAAFRAYVQRRVSVSRPSSP